MVNPGEKKILLVSLLQQIYFLAFLSTETRPYGSNNGK